MKIAFYTPTTSGGHAGYSKCLLEGLARAEPNHSLFLCTGDDLEDEFTSKLYQIVKLFPGIKNRNEFPSSAHWAISRLLYYHRRDRAFLHWVARNRPDVVHLQQEWFVPLARKLISDLKLLGVRVVITVHNLFRHEDHFPWHSKIQHFLEARAWRNADKIIAMSSRLANELIQIAGVRVGSIAVIPHFVWPNGSTYSADQMEARRKMRRVLLFGVIRRNKGIEDFIEGCKQCTDIKGLIAGYCPDKRYEKSLRARLESDDRKVEFTNRFFAERELPELYGSCSVAVFPYTSFSSQSGALFLATANETPIVGSDAGAIGVTIEEAKLGMVFPRGDVAKLSAALLRMHEPQEYVRAYRAARILKRHQSVEAVGAKLSQLYRSLH